MLARFGLLTHTERVQMFGVKIISGEWNAAYHDCLDQFGLVTLERRRLDLSLCLLYRKYVNSMCYFPEGLISRRCNSSYNILQLLHRTVSTFTFASIPSCSVTFASIIPSCSFPFSRVIPTLFSFFIKNFLLYIQYTEL